MCKRLTNHLNDIHRTTWGQRVDYTIPIITKLAKEIHGYVIFDKEIITERITLYADLILLKFSLGLKVSPFFSGVFGNISSV